MISLFQACIALVFITTILAAPAKTGRLDDPDLAPAVDMIGSVSLNQWTCLSNFRYGCAFIRVYDPAGNGGFDKNAIANLENAYTANVATEVYMAPQINSSTQINGQFDLVYDTLRSKGIRINRIWFRVMDPVTWSANSTANLAAIKTIVTRAASFNVVSGILTNHNSWAEITGGSKDLPASVLLWYQRILGDGDEGESPDDFSDFRPFGNWSKPMAKQYATDEYISGCSFQGNKDVYDVSLNVGQNNWVRPPVAAAIVKN